MVDKDTQETVFGISVPIVLARRLRCHGDETCLTPIGICEIQPDSSPHAQDTASTG